ncbi:FixH family protein [Roseospira marina]|uniref:FixH family protein n=1 Tax=Roseospira marina TaxID=140057 RepID=A0A5M6IHM4_9PROT|nr:FixH family protein [Roseospira marina]KAA5607289.1 FixH family protein [Roseospira marina]MBB4312556.1 nitrogen fixation protein FixH [Roseospira marina]MBB5085428.1 nitrogen fixation protein FixH [Roseospira marina]
MSGSTITTRQRGWWIPYTFVFGFVVVLGANLAMLYFATSTFSGLSTQHAYVEGLAYNDKVAAEAAQNALGWTWTVDLDAVPPGPGDERRATVRIDGRDGSGDPLDGATVTAEIRRPAEQGFDQTVTFQPAGPGAYEAAVDLPKPGLWDAVFTARVGSDTYTLRRRFRTE